MPAEGFEVRPPEGQRPARERKTALDVVIVGAGVIGLACAWRAAQRGLRVRVLERDAPGSGASGIAAGHAGAGRRSDLGRGAPARRRACFPPRVARIRGRARGCRGPRRRLLASGAVHVALDRDEAGELRRRFALMDSLGLDAEWLAPSECRELEPGLPPSLYGGCTRRTRRAWSRSRSCGAPRGVRAGGRVDRDAEVTAAIVDGDRLAGVSTASGGGIGGSDPARGGGLVGRRLAAGGRRPPVRPVKGQILTLAGRANRPTDRGDRAGISGPAPRRPPGPWRDRRGAGLRHAGHGRRRARAPARGLSGPARRGGARAGSGDRRPPARQPGQRADRGAARSTAWSSPPGTSATGSCSRRSPRPRSWRCSGERRPRSSRWRIPAVSGERIGVSGERDVERRAGELADGATVAQAVSATGAEPGARGVAVAIEGEVVPRGEWERSRVAGGRDAWRWCMPSRADSEAADRRPGSSAGASGAPG